MTPHPRLADLPAGVSSSAWLTFIDDETGEEVRWRHAELLARASRLAGELRVPGAADDADGERAAIVLDGPPSAAWVVAALAAMLARRPLVAFPETNPATSTLSALPPLPVHRVYSDEGERWPGLSCLPLAPLSREPAPTEPGDPATSLRFDVIAYTSGTTAAAGVKCFRMRPDSTEAFAEEFVRRFGLRPGDTWAVCHSFSHIVHFEYVLACLLQGIEVRIVSVADLLRRTEQIAPSAVVTVPAVYEQLARVLENRVRRSTAQRWIWGAAIRLPDRALSSGHVRRLLQVALPQVRSSTGGRLKVLILGAASSTPTLKRRLAALGLPVYEGYGMTELGMIACQSVDDIRLGTVGRPWPGLHVQIDDDGVLVVRPVVPRTDGYLVQPPGEPPLFDQTGMVSTGDLAVRDHEGHIRIIGRKKALIVTDRGKNVNPSVVEGRLGRLPQVLAAVPYGDGRPYLSAVVFLAADGPDVTSDELEAINADAPEHERVHSLVQTRVSPTTDNGLLTRSGKVRPSAVLDRYAADLDAFYRR